ncbi:ankyrin repeat-containing protein [Penicillium lividum]|nr:ankyrin repeat-containing protein [Penicillium lividum]
MAGPPELAPDISTDSLVSINSPVNAPVDEAHGLTSDAHRAPAPGTVHSDLDTDINVTGEDSLTPLHIASREGFVEVVKLLLHHKSLQKPAKFEAATSHFGETALHLASENGHLDVVKVLLDRKTSDNLATIEARTNYGETALHLASESGHADVVKVLLDRMTLDNPADIEAKNERGETALHLASQKGNLEVVKLLLHHKALHRPANIEATTSSSGETALHLASKKGNVDVVKLLLHHKALHRPANIEATTSSFGETALHLASENGHVDVVKVLLDRNALQKPANIEAKNEFKETPLHLASRRGNVDVVKVLLDRKNLDNPANIEAKNDSGETALHITSRRGNLDLVKVLLDCKTLDNPANIEAKNDSGETALHMASRDGRVEIVSLLLDAGARINEKDEFAWTPMHEAANSGKLEVVRLLRDKGADLEGRTITEEKTPLLMAISEQDVRVVDALLESNVAVNTPSNHYTPLTMACQYGPDELVEILLDHGADVTLTDPAEWQPLHVACRYSTAARVKIILERNPPIDVKTDDGWAPLHLAARYGNAEMVGMILKKGPEINTIGPGGWTPLHLAAENENDDPEIVRMLLEKEPDINIVDDDGQTPLHAATRYGNAEVMRTILEKGPEINAVDNDGWTPLHFAARYDGPEIVRMVLEKDPNINATDKRGQTSLHLAVRYGNAATVTMILEKRPEINAVDNDGWTALHKVPQCDAADDRASIAELLIRKGANFLTTKGENLTPLHVACEDGCISVVEVYLKHANSYDTNAREENGWTALHFAADKGFGKVVELLLRNGLSFDLKTEGKKKTALALSIEHLNAFSAECFEDQQAQQTSEPTPEQSTDRATEESIGEEESQTEQQAEKESLKDCQLAIRLLAQKKVDIIPAMASIRDLNSENGLELAIKILTSVDNFGKEADWEQQTRLIWRAMRPKEHGNLRSRLETSTPDTNTKPETVLQWAAYHGNFSVVWWIFQKTDPPQEDRAKAIKIVKERLNSMDKRKPKELSNVNRDGLKEQQAIGQPNKKGQETTKVVEKSKEKSHVSGQVKSKEAPDQHGLSTDEKDRYSHTLDILHDPPLGIGATKEKGGCEIPELKDIAREKVTQERKATIVNFYRHDGRVDLLRRSSDIRDVIYHKEKGGPASFMERTAEALKSIGLEGRVYEKENLTMRWVHLPANNVGDFHFDRLRTINMADRVTKFFQMEWMEVYQSRCDNP